MAMMVITMTAGTAMIMWLGEIITSTGIGSGISSHLHVDRRIVPATALQPSEGTRLRPDAVVVAIGLVIIAAVIFTIEQAQRDGFRCSTRGGWLAGGCSAARRRTSR